MVIIACHQEHRECTVYLLPSIYIIHPLKTFQFLWIALISSHYLSLWQSCFPVLIAVTIVSFISFLRYSLIITIFEKSFLGALGNQTVLFATVHLCA